MELFDFIDALFSPKLWREVSDGDKKKHFFIVQRFLSMKMPLQTQYFNHIGTNAIAAMNTWQLILSRQYKSKPQWLYDYNKVVKKSVEKKKKIDIDQKTIIAYKEINQLSNKDYDFLMELYPEEVIEELKVYEEYAD